MDIFSENGRRPAQDPQLVKLEAANLARQQLNILQNAPPALTDKQWLGVIKSILDRFFLTIGGIQ